MNVSRAPIRAVMLLAACAASAQQTTPTARPDPAIPPAVVHRAHPHGARTDEPVFNPNMIVLDPAHGGADDGAHLPGGALERDITMALAERMKPLLEARGFTVVLTHAASTDDVPLDTRTELANRSHAVACIILHASAAGHGVHLFTSSLTHAPDPSNDPDSIRPIAAWDTAQATALPQSTGLLTELATSFNGIRVPLVSAAASVRPIDSFSCPAVLLEIAPLASGSQGGPARTGDASYQQRVAEAAASALTLWRAHAVAAAMQAALTRSAEDERRASQQPAAVTKPRSKPKPKPVVPSSNFPEETPAGEAAPPVKAPAPIVRRPPPPAAAPNPPQTTRRAERRSQSQRQSQNQEQRS